jgi:hypothetical protein
MDEEAFNLKIYHAEGEVLVAVCDSELLGKRFIEGQLQLEVTAAFFGEEKASFEDVAQALEKATMANFVGERAVACAIGLQYVQAENVLRIRGIPCAQMVRM